jgi:general secretion pathway protein A
MYTGFYNLTGQPFQLTPDHRFFFGSRNHKKALAYLTYGLSQGEGFIVITGDIGAGKTTIVDYLLSTLDVSRYVPARVMTTQLAPGDLMRIVVSAFGLPHNGRDKADLLCSLDDFLRTTHKSGKRAVLIIDEAQNLPVRSLEELRMLSNLQVENRALLQSFLLGQPQFRRTLSSDALEQLRQRVIATYHLGPMDAEETRAYIEHRLRLVGWNNDPQVTENAFELIYHHTSGIPRKINTLGTRVLLFGALENQHCIDRSAVEAVVADLLQEGAESQSEGKVVRNGAIHNGDMALLSERLRLLEEIVRQEESTVREAVSLANRYLEDWVRANLPGRRADQ